MINFWLVVAGLLTLSSAFIFWPLIAAYNQQQTRLKSNVATTKTKKYAKTPAKAAGVKLSLQQQRNIEIFKERLQELEAEQQQGTLDQESLQQLKIELEKSLLSDVGQSATAELQPVDVAAPHWLIAALISITVVIASLSLYQILGRGDDYSRYLVLRDSGMLNNQVAANKPAAPDFNKAITVLLEKLKENPQDLQKWYLLANSYAATQQFNKAAEVFLRIQTLVGKDSPEYASAKGAYAQSLYLANNEQVNDAVRVALDEALAIDPQEANALVLNGIDAYQKGTYQEAITIWEKSKLKANSRLIEEFIAPSIAAAQEKLGITPKNPFAAPALAANAPDDKQAGGIAKLDLNVDIASELKAKVTPEQVVFIFASPVGAKMPLAVQRIQVKDLPAKVTLDDSKSVMPTAKLSSAAMVDVTARISFSGQAMPQTGDLFGRQEKIDSKQTQQALSIVINQVVP